MKYIIELEKIEGTDLYRAVGANALVFEQWLRELVDNQPKVGEWIPCSERLPDKGAFCPKYQVMTKYGITEGWYNPDLESWYILVWFMSEDFREYNINIKRGDIPKRLRVPKGIVIAWQPSPEPWEGGQK